MTERVGAERLFAESQVRLPRLKSADFIIEVTTLGRGRPEGGECSNIHRLFLRELVTQKF